MRYMESNAALLHLIPDEWIIYIRCKVISENE